MLDCDQALELISAKVDDALTSEESAALEEHLAACAACRALLADFEGMHQALPQLAVQPPPELKGKIMDSVRQAKVTPFQARRKPRRWRSIASLAAVLALVIVGGYTARTGLFMGSNAGGAPAAGADSRQLPESQSAENGLTQEAAVAQDKEAGTASVYTAQAPLSTATPLTAESALAQLADYLGWQTADKQATLRVETDSTDALSLSGPAGADGSVPTLTFTGLSEDGTAYEFTLTQDGEETLYRVLLDGGAVEAP